MARVPYLQQSDLPPEHQDILARPIALNRAMANNPNAAKAMTGLAMHIRHHSKLDPRLREMAILQVGYVTRSPYEFSHHIKIGRDFGVTDDDIHAIEAETRGEKTNLTPLERATLRAAREMTAQPDLSQETFAELQSGLGNQLVVDLLLTISVYCGVVRLLAALQIDVEDDYQRYLQEFPLPG